MTRTRGMFSALFLLVLTAIPAQAATTDFRVLLDTDHDGTTGCVVAGMPGVDLVFRTQVTTTDTAATVTRTSRQLCSAGALGAETGIDTTVWPALLQPASGALAVETMIPFSAFGGTLDEMRIGVQASSGAAVHTALVRPDGSPALYPGLTGKRRSVSAPGAARTITLDGNDSDWFGINPFLNGIAGSGAPGLRMVKVSTFADVVTNRLYFLFDANISTDAPIASDDEYDRPAGSNLTIPAPGVLANDSDVTGQPLTATPVSPAEHGSVVLNPDGSFTYTPDDPSTADSDEFEYKASNGTKESTPARVRINVALVGNSTPVGNNDSYNATEDAQLSVSAKGVLQNDHDGNGDSLKATLVTGPSHGTVVLNMTGGFTYTPAVNFFGTDTFTYEVSDGKASDTAVVTISIAAVNDAPAVQSATFSVDENSSEGTVVGTVEATDVEGDDVSFAITGGDPDDAFEIDANTGTISVANPAALDRETNPEFDLEIRVTDSGAPAAADDGPIRVNIGNVDEAPVVADHELSTDEDTPLPITLTGNDPESTPLTFTIVQAPLHGTLSGAAPNIVYTPAPDFAGSDAFVYTAGDGVFDSSVSTVAITINPVNDAPVGNVDVYATLPGLGFSISPNAGVLANDVDADGDPLVAVIVDPPSHGTINFNLDGGFAYVPHAGFSGIDTFSYTVVEASSLVGARRGPQNMAAPVTVVSINVHATNNVPVANAQSVELDEDTQKIITLTGTDADGDALQYNINTSPAHGTLSAAGPQVRYIPDPNYSGPDSFTFTMTDGFASSAPKTVSILVKPINDAPNVANDVYGTLRNTQLTVNAANGVLGNDQDVDNASLTAVLLSGPAHGTLSLNANGSFVYTPTTGFSGSDSFRYRASDGVATSNQPARVTINVRTTNAAPVAHAATVNTDEDVAVGVTLTGSDPDGDAVELEIVTQPANGVLTGSLPNLAYTPNPNFNGTDTFTFRASDGFVFSPAATITIVVGAVNDAPVATAGTETVAEESTLNGSVAGLVTDVDSNSFTFSLVTDVTHGTLVLATNGTYTYTPDPNFSGSDAFGWVASDGSASSNMSLVTITVTDVNEAPVFTSTNATNVAENTTAVLTVTTSDFESDAIAYSITGGADAGDFSINAATGALVFNAAPNFEAPADADSNNAYVVQVTANDGTDSTLQTITVTVTDVNEAPSFTSGTTATAAENTLASTTVYTAAVSDPEGDTITFSIGGGADAGDFTINSSTGQLTFASARDFEAPADADANNVYTVQIAANDGANSVNITVNVTVTDANEAPAFTSTNSTSVAENTTAVMTVAAADQDGDAVTYSISGGADAGDFSINATTGVLTFNAAPDFEAPADADTNNVYLVQVTATDGSAATQQVISVTVTDVNEAAVFASANSASLAENTTTSVLTVVANDPEGGSVTYSVTGGADAADFSIDSTTGALSFNALPNFEAPADADANNVYLVEVTANDGVSNTAQTITVTVTNANDAPVVTSSATLSVPENQHSILTLTSTDEDGDTVTWSVTGGADGTFFSVNSTTGALTFNMIPNFEIPSDANADNVWVAQITANDGTSTTNQVISVTITNVDEIPVFTSATSSMVPENQTAVMTVTATDPEGQAVTFAITAGADMAHFTINAVTGELSFVSAPNFENPADADADNSYVVGVQANDGTLQEMMAITVLVTNTDEAPSITSSNSATIPENTLTAATVTATEPDGQTVSFSITGGADQALFSIDSSTGVLTFDAAPDFENPADAGGNNQYEVEVTAGDGTNTVAQTITITVSDVNEAPAFTSGATVTVAEGTTAVTTVTTTDEDGDTVTYSITGGADAADFSINSTTGALTFGAAPDFEAPADADTDNVYVVEVTANDGTNTTAQTITVTVTNNNEAPAITSANSASVAENTLAVLTATATDQEGNSITWSVTGGADAGVFAINASTGALSFNSLPDFEGPGDTGLNNEYVVEITANDGTNDTTQTITVTVTNVNEAPAITSGNTASVAENTTAVLTATATDQEGNTITWSIAGGADAGDFTINASTGALTFTSAPDFETPADADTNNQYAVTIRANDGTSDTDQTVTVTVTDANEAPSITSANAATIAENTSAAIDVDATDVDAGTTLSFSITGGADAGDFSINATTGALTFTSAPDFETPADADTNNDYVVEVTVTDGSLTDVQTITISVTNANEAPAITTGGTASVAENTTAVTDVDATDVDAGTTLTFSISGGADAADFGIVAGTGVLTFNSAPDFEAPADADTNNQYVVEVTVSDGTASDVQTITVTVTNANEAPSITSANSASIAENTSAAIDVDATDVDAGTTLSFSITGGADAGDFSINTSTGALTFGSAPDFESPADADTDNAYVVEVTVTDGSLTDVQTITISVTNANEAPAITTGGTASVAENTTAVTDVDATDVDAGTTLTFSISGGADAADFGIVAGTGVLTFNSAPDFEAPADADTNNQYVVEVTVSDGTATDVQTITVTVTDANEAPAITTGNTASVAENTTAAIDVDATDVDAGATLSFSITGGADGPAFSINTTTGAVTFNSAQNFESPTDIGTDNTYEVEVTVTDGSLTDVQTITVTVTDANEAPSITSGATAFVTENTTDVTDVDAIDVDAGTTLTFSISGGADAADFGIVASTGVLTFNSAPDFESPGDANGDNEYIVEVTVSDGTDTDVQTITVMVSNANEAPSFTSSASQSAVENQVVAGDVDATDPDAATTLSYSVTGGADAALFTIHPGTGVLSFNSAPDFETPADAGTDNVYDVEVTVSDASVSAIQNVAVTVTNENEAPSITSANTASVAENTVIAIDVNATDADAGSTLTFSISGGADAGDFTIDGSTGVLSFNPAPDFEAPADADANHEYIVEVTVGDGSLTDVQTITVTVTAVNEAPSFTSANTAAVPENTTAAIDVNTTDPEGNTVTYSVTGGADELLFGIDANTGALSFLSAPDFETPQDANADNFYVVEVTANDGTNNATQTVTVEVENGNELPTFTSTATPSVPENQTAVVTVATNDVDGDTVTYSITGGADAADFSINTSTGALTFSVAPNFEAPHDADTDNVYLVDVTADDGPNTVVQNLVVTVTAVNEAPAYTSNDTFTQAENITAVTTVSAADPEGVSPTYTVTGGADSAKFTIGLNSGALSFVTAPDFDVAGDANADNVYVVEVTATDGTTPVAQTISVTITGVPEAPVVSSSATPSVPENMTTAADVDATDPEGAAVTYTIAGGDDAADFSIDANSGVLTFAVAPNFEAPHDADTNNIYLVNVEVDDGSMPVVQNLTVTVTNVDEAPSITSLATANVNENQTSAIDVNATDPDAGATLTYSISGGADQAKFSIVSGTGVLTFLSAPNFESPTDAGADNVYDVDVEVTDGTTPVTQSIAITVDNVDEAPEFSSAATANVDENTTAVLDIDATDPEGAGITYSISGGADQALFSINSSTGVLTFASAPNFESPTDAGANNVYDVQVQASAGVTPGTQNIAVTVINVNEAPVITITDNAIDTNEDTNASMNGGAGSTLASIADPDGNVTVQVTLTATQGTLSLNGVTGVTFVAPSASNDGVDDTTLVFTGTVSNVNARLNGMVYKPNLNYFGNADVDISVSDLGNTGSGSTLTDGPDNIDITVIPVNDAPVATAKTHATHSGIGLTITSGSHAGALKDDAEDVDDADNELTVQLFGSPSNTEALVQLDATTGASLGSFYFDPPGGFTGAITFQYKVCDDNAGDPNQCSAATTVTVNVGGQETWFIDDAAACGVNCTGSRARPLIGLNTTDAQFLARGTGDSIFVNSGTYGTGITMNASERLIGQGSSSIQTALNHNYAAYPAANGTLDTLPGSSTAPIIGGTVNAAASTTVRGVAINSGAAKGYVGTGASQTVLETSVTSGNTAVEMTNATTSSVTFSSTTSTGGTHGINLSNVSGTFDFGTGGSLPTDGLKNHTTAGFQLVNASAGTNVVDIDYSGVIQPGTGRAVVIGTTDGSSGANVSRGLEGASTVSLTGNMTGGGIAVYESVGGTLDLPGLLSFNTGANNALDLVDNDGTTFNLSNGNLTITTANGTGINATDGGTLNITGNDNTITTTGTGRAFNFAGTSAAAKMAGTLRFKSINKSGSNAKGIVVNNHSGTFTITGDDNNDNTPDSLTAGGTITGTTQRGAEFVAVDGAVSLAGMTFTNATTTDGAGVAADCGNTLETSATKHCNAPLYFDTLPGGTTLRSITVDGSVQNGIIGYDMTGLAMTSVTVKNGGSESSEAGGLAVRNLMGTNSITNSQFLNNTKDQVKIVNLASKNMTSLTVLGSTFEGNRLDGVGNHIDAAGLIVTNNATIGTINIGNGSVAGANSFSDMFSNGVQYAGNGAAASVTFNVNKNSFDNVNAGIVVAHGSTGSGGSLTYNLSNNTIVAGPLSQGTAIQATGFQGHNLNGSIVGNTIGTQGVVGSGSQCNGCGNGIHIDHEGTGRCDVDIIGNTIQRVNSAAIQVTLLPLSAKGDIVITGNLVRDPDAGVFAGIYVKGGSTSSSTNCVAATIGGSVTPGSWPSQTANAKNRVEGSWGSSIAVQRSGGTFNVPGFTPTVSAWITGNNSLVDPVTVLGTGYATGASCP